MACLYDGNEFVAEHHVFVVDAADFCHMQPIALMLLPFSMQLLPMRQLVCQLLYDARLLLLLHLAIKLRLYLTKCYNNTLKEG